MKSTSKSGKYLKYINALDITISVPVSAEKLKAVDGLLAKHLGEEQKTVDY